MKNLIINYNSYVFGFQEPATPIMEGVIDLHNHIFFYAVLILVVVCKIFFDIVSSNGYFMYNLRKSPKGLSDFLVVEESFNINKVGVGLSHHTILEVVWTIIPTLILISIAIPSFVLLYSMDEVSSPTITMKVVAHQWYWSYEYCDFGVTSESINVSFDSYMIATEELELGMFRLLSVDNEIIVPTNVHVRLIVTSEDVLHSFSVNSLGIKLDAVPGRLSQTTIFIKREGTYYGQCSELCGVNHGFMPIVLKAVSLKEYVAWHLSFK